MSALKIELPFPLPSLEELNKIEKDEYGFYTIRKPNVTLNYFKQCVESDGTGTNCVGYYVYKEGYKEYYQYYAVDIVKDGYLINFWEFDKHGNEIYSQYSDGSWIKTTRDEFGNVISKDKHLLPPNTDL
jgi:hypothetical protein